MASVSSWVGLGLAAWDEIERSMRLAYYYEGRFFGPLTSGVQKMGWLIAMGV